MSGEFSVWDPILREFTFEGGKVVRMGPLKAKQFSRVQTLARPVLEMLTDERLHEIYGKGSPAVIALVSVASGEDVAWLEEQDPDVIIQMLGAALEINADFSLRRIAPAMNQLVETAHRAARIGDESSQSSDS